MLRVSKRSLSTALRSGGLYVRSSAIDPSTINHDSAVDNDGRLPLRWYSTSTAVKRDASTCKRVPMFSIHGSITGAHSLPRNSLLVGKRYEATAAAAAADASDPPAEKFEYQAEVSRLMDLIVHSLYSNKEVFLRELVSNASDALDKLRFLSVTEPNLLMDAVDLDIRIQTDKDNGIIHIIDSGIGMTRQELLDCLGTIAQSGTAKFLKAVKDSKEAGADNNLIGQFGVGFYSAFLVSDRVVVSTKSPKSDKQDVWDGEANASSYTVREETDPEKLIPRA